MKIADKRKITVGFVTQYFDENNRCTAQEFTAGDQVDWEDAEGNALERWDEYHSYEMEQPKPGVDPSIAEYIENNGVACFQCGVRDLSCGEFQTSDSRISRGVFCGGCKKEWTDEFTLTGVTTDG